MKRLIGAFGLALLLVPGTALAQEVVVQAEAGVVVPAVQADVVVTPPPPTVVVAPAQTGDVVYVPAQPVVVEPVEEGPPAHQISAGVGIFACAFGAGQWGSGSACVSDEFLFLNIPIIYRYRFHEYLAAGGGLMISIFSLPDWGTLAGGSLVGSFRAYAVPDWLYFDLDVLLGFPAWFLVQPVVGLSIPLGPLAIVFENQFPLFFFYGIAGWWQPMVGVEFFF